jgi:hypothetical protein
MVTAIPLVVIPYYMGTEYGWPRLDHGKVHLYFGPFVQSRMHTRTAVQRGRNPRITDVLWTK